MGSGEGADDIFLNLAAAMRSAGKMSGIKKSTRHKFEQADPWKYTTHEVNYL
jgi:hypothetical protein